MRSHKDDKILSLKTELQKKKNEGGLSINGLQFSSPPEASIGRTIKPFGEKNPNKFLQTPNVGLHVW